MRSILLPLLVSAVALSAPQSILYAQDAPATGGTEAAAAEARVPAALSKMHSFNGTPSSDARIYVYLQSASWCGPCVQEMPEIAREYPKMKEHGIELILIGCDDTEEAALKFLNKYNASFPGIHYKEEGLKNLPGYTPARGVPDATFVDREGNVIKRGHGALVKNWRRVLNTGTPQQEQPAAAPRS